MKRYTILEIKRFEGEYHSNQIVLRTTDKMLAESQLYTRRMSSNLLADKGYTFSYDLREDDLEELT